MFFCYLISNYCSHIVHINVALGMEYRSNVIHADLQKTLKPAFLLFSLAYLNQTAACVEV